LRFLPLSDGTIWAYDAVDEETGTNGLIVTRANKLAGARFTLTSGNRTRTLEVRADGIAYVDSEAYVLKASLAVGSEWPGERGSIVRVSAVDKLAEVPAGTFAGCVETVEELAAPSPAVGRRVTTLFCPDVGIVLLRVEVWDGGKRAAERMVLRSFGKPVTIAK
jgi:hypothetical protein